MRFSRFFLSIIVIVVIVSMGGSWLASRGTGGIASTETTHQPTIGDPRAPVHVVVFEEPKCGDCREYNRTIFPLIQREFIDTHQIIYTVIPISFLPYSMPGAIALLCVYNQDPGYPNADLFIKFLDNLFKNDWVSVEDILQMAQKTSPSIDLDKLKKCIIKEGYRAQIQNNLALVKKLGHDSFFVPAIYVNGHRVSELSFDAIKQAILDNQS